MLNLLPKAELRSVRHYYWIVSLANCWFATATWIFFVQRYLSLTTFGIVDSAIFALGLLLEIPTGALADMLGKKKAIQLAMLFLSVGSLTMGLSQDKFWLITAMALAQVGLAFYSGSVEAFVYDSLLDENAPKNYDSVIATGLVLINVVSALTTALGGWLFEWHFRAPLLSWSVGNWLGLMVSFAITEPRANTLERFSLKKYWQQTKLGSRALFHPKLLPLLPLMLCVLGVVYLWEWGMVRTVTATFFKIPVVYQAVLYAILPLLGAALIQQLPKLRTIASSTVGMLVIALILAAAYGSFGWESGTIGVFIITTIGIIGSLAYPWSSVVINQQLPSQFRATAISTLALLTKIPYVLFSPVIGLLADTHRFHLYGWGVGLALLLTSLFTGIKQMRMRQVSST